MFYRILFIVSIFSSSTILAKEFGESSFKSKQIKLDSVVKSFKNFEGKTITTECEVKKVCKKKGCWMEVSDAGTSMRVTFKDYSFFVPTDLVGKRVTLEGQVIEKVVSVKEARHYLEDGGASPAEIAKVTKPTKKYRFIATGVRSM